MDCLCERAEFGVEMMRGCEGGNVKISNSLAAFIRAVYHEEKGHGLLCPEMNKKKKKSSSLSVSLRRIISPKSEQINHLEKMEGVCVCGAPSCECVTSAVCISAFVSVHPCL